MEYGEVKLLPPWKVHTYILETLAWEGILKFTKEKLKHQHSHTFGLQSAPPAIYVMAMLAQNLWE